MSTISPDAELVALGEAFEAAFAKQNAEGAKARKSEDWTGWDAAYAATKTVVHEMEKQQAVTLAGFRVKARCIQWCYGDEPVPLFTEHNGWHIKSSLSCWH